MSGRRVLHVSQTDDGGVGRFLEYIVADQVRRGDEVAVAVPPEGRTLAGALVEPWRLRSTGPSPWLPLEVRSLAGIVRRFRPEVVHLHSSKAGLAGRLLLRRRLPTLFQPHSWSFLAVEGPVARATLAWERAGARWADVIVCVSDDERRVGEERGIHPPGYRVFPHGVDLERWPAPPAGAREQARAGLGLDTAPLAVCVGRLHRQKRQHALLDIWPQVREAVPGARLALVGDGPDRAALEARAVEGVSFAGAVDDVREWLLAASLVVQPSKWEAGVPLSVMEALACGRGVVATDAPGLRDIGRDLPGTPVVPVDDEIGLRDAIAERLANPDRADREGAAGRAFAEARDDLGRQMAGIRGLYEEIVEGRSRA